MEHYLDEMVNYLSLESLILVASSNDGRVNSIANEDQIINLLRKKYPKEIDVPNIRSWYDFGFRKNNQEIYVNVKVSYLNNGAADNLSSKIGMGYALTGIKDMPIDWDSFNEMLAENLRYGYDYYFLIVNKNDTSDIFWTSLKRIKELRPNGSNLPFQCDWGKNREPSGRSEDEATRYILSVYVSSWDKKTNGYPERIKNMLSSDMLIRS
ncbi:restriction endonuclease [Candidatus Saccharibacteria bacterium]|nr:restriction endonuclease [Candidatus Saccharibacteria bacterium]